MHFQELKAFYQGKKVFLTGHTGFKGAWLSLILQMMGAECTGYALKEEPGALFSLLNLEKGMHSIEGDVRDYDHLRKAMQEVEPELVFHLAAQPLVRESYLFPRETYETNVMGTVNLLEAVRHCPSVRSVLNVTTDKVYENPDQEGHAFMEEEKLDGHDPYSNSKSCSELVTHSYQKSFFSEDSAYGKGKSFLPRISTARAGNVIGGGDFAKDRIIPDCVRKSIKGEPIGIRNPYSVRPYEHVLEPLFVYLEIVARQAGEEGKQFAGYYNVGPELSDAITTGALAELFVEFWGENASWENQAEPNAPHEAGFLQLSTEKLKKVFGWQPRYTVKEAVEKTVDWYKAWHKGEDLRKFSEAQVLAFASASEA